MSGSKKLCYIYTMEYYTAERKKELLLFVTDSMDGNGERYAKQNTPGGERQIPYYLTYKRNIMNKIN